MKRKILAVALVISMALSMFSTSVLADASVDITIPEQVSAEIQDTSTSDEPTAEIQEESTPEFYEEAAKTETSTEAATETSTEANVEISTEAEAGAEIKTASAETVTEISTETEAETESTGMAQQNAINMEVGRPESELNQTTENVSDNGDIEITASIGEYTVTASLSEGTFPEDTWINVEKLSKSENNIAEQNAYDTMSEHIDNQEDVPVPDENIYTAIENPVITSFEADSYQIEVCYRDADNEIKELPSEQQENLTLEFIVQGETDEGNGEFSEVEVFSLSEDLQTSEYLEDDTTTYSASDVYTIALCTYTTEDYDARYAAEEKACSMMKTYTDPSSFLGIGALERSTSQEHYKELQQVAANVITGLSTDYDKIQKLTRYVAETIYYDYVYYETMYCPDINRAVTSTSTPLDPYDVYTKKYTVCAGYSYLLQTLLISQNIPCMVLHGDDHAFNAAYDSSSGSWIIIDSTWASGNTYGKNGTTTLYKGSYNSSYFNMTLERLASIDNHEIYYLNNLLSNNGYYKLNSNTSQWTDTTQWYCSLTGNKDSSVSMVSALDSFPVTEIKSNAFYGNTTLKKIVLSDSISSIDYATFYQCSNLKTVVFSDSIKTIGDYAFANCSNLTGTITIPSKVTKLGYACFSSCKKITSVKFKCEKLTSIGDYAFYQCTAIKGKLTLPSNVTSLGISCFYNCAKITSISFPSVLKKIGDYAFYNCSGLSGTLYLPYKLTSIGYAAFYKNTCYRIFIHQYVKTIGAFNFKDSVIKKVYYYGTKSGWGKISIGSSNGGLKNAKFKYSYRQSQSICVAPTAIYYSVSSLKASSQTFKINVTGGITSISYKSSSQYITVSSKGTVTLKKKTPKGTYKITVTAKGTDIYESSVKTVKIVVK